MENILGLLVIACVISLSKKTGLAWVILLYYVAAFILDDVFIPHSQLTSLGITEGAYNVVYYIAHSVLGFVVVFGCLISYRMGFSFIVTSRLYAVWVVLFYISTSLMMVVYEIWSIRLIPEFHYTLMSCAVFVDIMFTILGTDNKISRSVNFKTR